MENTEAVWNDLSSALKSFIFSKVKNEADSDDILQDVYLKIHDNIDSLKDKTRIKPWIYQISRNLIIDYFRNIKKNQTEAEIINDLASPSGTGRYMDTAVGDMIRMMDDLPPEYCEALCMTEIDGLSQKEYAEKTGLSYSGAKSRIQRARVLLKDMLLKCCHYQFDRYGTVIDIQPLCCCCCPHEKKS